MEPAIKDIVSTVTVAKAIGIALPLKLNNSEESRNYLLLTLRTESTGPPVCAPPLYRSVDKVDGIRDKLGNPFKAQLVVEITYTLLPEQDRQALATYNFSFDASNARPWGNPPTGT